MKSSWRLFRIAGIDIGVHYTWLFIFVLITWSLAGSIFPQQYPGWSTATYWITGILAALLLFFSVLLHELAHSLVAQARGLKVGGITLFIFGGVSSLEEEPEKPRTEFAMAIVGPVTSLVLAAVFWGLSLVAGADNSPLVAMLGYLALINFLLAIFNLLPGFPLDGGRVLRSILWGTTGSLRKATNIAATIGQVLGWAMIVYGLLQFVSGVFLGGMGGFSGLWFALIGWFLSSAADSSRREMTLREHLSGVKVRDVMNTQAGSIGPETTVEEVVWDIFKRQHGRAVPVCSNDRLLGIVTIDDVKKVPREQWVITPVERIMTREPLYTVTPEDGLYDAFKMIAQHAINQVLVTRDGRCVGMLSRADIISHLQLSQELGEVKK